VELVLRLDDYPFPSLPKRVPESLLKLRALNEGRLILQLLHREWADYPSLRTSNDCHPSIMIPPSLLVITQGWRLIDLPLRASNEGLLRPRVARARKIVRLHPRSPVDSLQAALLDFKIQF